uniref:Uncharacterized protein n=1 Tax=Romanomermis culicivorax TaxID=13658 RepID=A0A915IT28_ROMCU
MFEDPRFSTMPQPQGGPFALPLPLPPPKCHSYSHSDVHSVLGVGGGDSMAADGPFQQQQPATHGRKGKAYYKEKRRTGAGSVDGLSLAGGVECHSSSVFDQTVQNTDDVIEGQKSPSRDQNGVVFRSTTTDGGEKIYESLSKGVTEKNSLLTTADVEFEKNRETKGATLDFSRPESFEFREDSNLEKNQLNNNGVSQKKTLVTEDARQVMLRNEKLLAEAEAAKKVDDQGSEVTVEVVGEVTVENLEKHTVESTTTTPEDQEKMVEPTLKPFLPKRQIAKPQNFDPMDSWRSLNSIPNLQTLRDHYQKYDLSIGREISVKENLRTKIWPTIPNRFAQPEPVYLGYDEKLPEFKKRLIETGTFDFGPPTTTTKTMAEKKSTDFRKNDDDDAEKRDEFSPNLNRNEKFRTNSSTNRPAENSDIDF